MHRTSIFGITADLKRSHGSYLRNLNTGSDVLDLFGMYSSLPLGYNHPAFDSVEFKEEVLEHAGVKLPNCEMGSAAAAKFLKAFVEHPSMAPFTHFHFASTGALAVEAAVKAAMIATGRSKVLTHRNNFHGINGYGGLLAAHRGPAAARLIGLPSDVLCVAPAYQDASGVYGSNASDSIAGVLVEPIQCTAGDVVLDVGTLQGIRAACTACRVPLIFDEIQTGFGGTGTLWYFEQLGIIPDIVIFGKKSQVSGIMVRDEYAQIFNTPAKLEVTWDGDVIDMIRCRAILEAYKREGTLHNVAEREKQFVAGIDGLRHAGLLMALDFMSREERDRFVWTMWNQRQTILIPTGELTVRMRPNLAMTQVECDEAIERIEYSREQAAA